MKHRFILPFRQTILSNDLAAALTTIPDGGQLRNVRIFETDRDDVAAIVATIEGAERIPYAGVDFAAGPDQTATLPEPEPTPKPKRTKNIPRGVCPQCERKDVQILGIGVCRKCWEENKRGDWRGLSTPAPAIGSALYIGDQAETLVEAPAPEPTQAARSNPFNAAQVCRKCHLEKKVNKKGLCAACNIKSVDDDPALNSRIDQIVAAAKSKAGAARTETRLAGRRLG